MNLPEAKPAPRLEPREFARLFAELVKEHGNRRENERCVQCVDCLRCVDSTFCKASRELARCNYCVDCEGCIDSNHCFGSRTLVGCTHCAESDRCSRSAYLERCADCDDCRYCFGCVGLSGREFHILNRPYGRSEYFKMTVELKQSLR